MFTHDTLCLSKSLNGLQCVDLFPSRRGWGPSDTVLGVKSGDSRCQGSLLSDKIFLFCSLIRQGWRRDETLLERREVT